METENAPKETTLATKSYEFVDISVRSVDMNDAESRKFIGKNKLEHGNVFFLSDGETRIKATLVASDGVYTATPHWGTSESVVVGRN